MSKYMIDHGKYVIHRTRFVTDQCEHKQIVIEDQQFLVSAAEYEGLIALGYNLCIHCH
ncbi:hypothetical protein [Geomicrobium sp. JCM 19055]|uniref:hypothetical protein n=1 Tax=Geomicrobium sp. JCM 19055 TaxID=1460649 RepID=UPI00045EDD8B|nr:hypothetical protein [Geomicrobium sp. JCM 19055]GAJ97272.1 hypothetical protein JCM19055_117 [Geomicrobium sp. JCM 19055]